MVNRIRCALLATLALGGCDVTMEGAVEVAEQPVGPAGGAVVLGSGAGVTVPAGALAAEVAVSVAELGAGAVEGVPLDVTPASAPFAFTPHGQTFEMPVTIEIPYDTTAGADLRVLRLDDELDTTWEVVPEVRFADGVASFESTHFSVMRVGAMAPTADAGPGGTDAGPGGTDAGPGETDAGPGGADAGPGGTDAGPGGTDAGPGGTDAGPGGTDAGPGGTDAGPGGTDAGSGGTDAGPPGADAGPGGA